MKVKLDFTPTNRKNIPVDGDYNLRCLKHLYKQSNAGFPKYEMYWEPYNPPSGVTQDQLENVTIIDHLSLQAHALFSFRNLVGAANLNLECAQCQNLYTIPPKGDFKGCPKCGHQLFDFDDDQFEGLNVGAFCKVEPDQKGENMVSVVKKYTPLA